MLSNLVTGKLQSQFIVIQDSVDQSGLNVLRAFTQHQSKRDQHNVHILCFENHITKLQDLGNDAVQFHDCFSDHRGWNNGHNQENPTCDAPFTDCGLLQVVKAVAAMSMGDFVVVIDSLSPVFFNRGVSQCYKDIHTLLTSPVLPGKCISQLLCVAHEDLLPDSHSTLLKLRHLATTYVQVHPPTAAMQGRPIANITHRKQGGKIIKAMEHYSVDSNNQLTSTEVDITPKASAEPVSNTGTMQELTTFKLGLGLKEQQARSHLVLPYLRPEAQVNQGEKGGQIFYQPDAADDWDEEDPDDDLDV